MGAHDDLGRIGRPAIIDRASVSRVWRDWSLALGAGLARGRAIAARLALGLILLTTLALVSCTPSDGPPDGASAQTGGAAPAAGLPGGEERPGAGWHALNDLAQGRIGVILGTLHAAYAERTYPQARVTAFNTTTDLIMALEGGKVDAALVDAISGQVVLKTHPDLGVLEDGFFVYPLGIGFRRDRGPLRARFDRFLERVRADGRYAEMHGRWFSEDPERARMPQRRAEHPGERYVLGVSVADLPYVAYQDGRYVGFDIEVLEQFAADEGIDLEIRALDFGALIPALAAGKVDLIADGMAITEERRKAVDFSAPYGEGRAMALALKSRLGAPPPAQPGTRDAQSQPPGQAGWQDLDDLAGGHFGLVIGSAAEAYLQQTYPRARITTFHHAADMILALKNGRLDAVMMDANKARVPLRANPDLSFLPAKGFVARQGVGFRRDDGELRRRFDRFLETLRQDGTLAAMQRRWVDDPEGAAMPEIPPPAAPSRQLTAGVVIGDLPFVSLRDGQLVGLDVELLKRFAASEGFDLRFQGLDFGSLIPSLVSGKADLIAYGIYITEERLKSIAFSTPYLDARLVGLVRRENLARTAPPAPPVTGWRRLEDLAEGRIAAFTGTATDLYATRTFPRARVLNFNGKADLVLALKTGKADVALTDAVDAQAIVRDNPELAILDDDFLNTPIAAAFRPQDDDLRGRFDRFLGALRADGTLEAIHRRWTAGDPAAATMPAIPVPDPGTDEPLRVGTSLLAGPPYVFLAGQELAGSDVELIRRFAAREGLPIEIVPLEFDALIAALAAGKIDLIVARLSDTEERRKRVDFSAPYDQERSAALVQRRHLATPTPTPTLGPSSGAGGWRSLDDLATGRIAVFAGTIQDRFLETHYPQAQVVHLASQADLVTALKTGKVDAGLIVATNARTIQHANPEIGSLGEPLLPVSQAVAFRPQDPDLRGRFDRFMALILADGTHQAMRQRWFGDDPSEAVMPEIPLPEQGPTLRCGVSVLVGLPYVALVDGRYVGFDVELVRRFAAHEGLGLSIAPMEFSALIPALAAGKLDLVASALGVTEERQRQVAFSSPYAEVSSVVLALKRNLAADREAGAVPGSAPTVGTPPWLDGLAESLHANFVLEGRWRLIVNGLWVTVLITVAATLFGTLLGGAVCWLRMSQHPALRLAGASYIFLIRGLPVLLLLMLIFYVAFASVNIDPLLVAVIAFGMNFAAYVSEMFRSGIEGVGRGQTEAGIAMGFTPFQTFRYIVLPQAGRRILPVYRGEFISLVKMTSIVGYIGVQDLTKAGDIIRSRTFEAFFPLLMIAAVYFLIIWALGLVLDHIDRRTDPRARRRARGAT